MLCRLPSFVTVILATLLPLIVSGSNCTGWVSSGTYIDTVSQAFITTMCSNPTTKWQKYQCANINGIDGWMKCQAQKRLSSCPPGSLKGIALLYHGFSACPEQYNAFATQLQAQCYHVYMPVSPGHGRVYCNGTANGCVEGYNLTGLPTTRAGYRTFIQMMNTMFGEEVASALSCEAEYNNQNTPRIVVGGLSLGASLAATALIESSPTPLFTDFILMSPFLGISTGALDNAIFKCGLSANALRSCVTNWISTIRGNTTSTQSRLVNLTLEVIPYIIPPADIATNFQVVNLLIRMALERVVENPPPVNGLQNVLDLVFGWGQQCETDQAVSGRGGFCKFRIRHLCAAHSLGQWAIREAGRVPKPVRGQVMMVERDGTTRNGLALEYVQRIYKNVPADISSNSKACMFLISSACKKDPPDNTCGVPHSNMAYKDNLLIPPRYMWWNETSQGGLLYYLNGQAGKPADWMTPTWDGTRNLCVAVDVVKPPQVLAADIPNPLQISFESVSKTVSTAVKEGIMREIANLTGLSYGMVKLVSSFAEKNGLKNGNTSVEVTMNLPAASTTIASTIVNQGGLQTVNGQKVETFQASGVLTNFSQAAAVAPTVPTTTTKPSGNNGGGGSSSSGNEQRGWMIGFIVLVVILGLLCLVPCCWYIVQMNQQSGSNEYGTSGSLLN